MLALLMTHASSSEARDDAPSPDRAAWERLVTTHQRQVLVAMLAEGLGLDDARDVSQEAWGKVWNQHRQGVLPQLQFPGIVITQARFLARDLLRRRRIAPHTSAEHEVDAQASLADTEQQLVSAQTLGRVHAALRELPAQKQHIFRLACDEGLPHAEIAHRFGLSLQRVKQIVWEVRCALRASLPEDV